MGDFTKYLLHLCKLFEKLSKGNGGIVLLSNSPTSSCTPVK